MNTLFLGFCVAAAAATGQKNVSFDDRINLNLGIGGSYATNGKGGYSHSETVSHGLQIGILYPDRYDEIASNTGSHSNSQSSGSNAPSSWSSSEVGVGHKYANGSVEAGYAGGEGGTFASDISQQVAVPIGEGVLLININATMLNTTTTKEPANTTMATTLRPQTSTYRFLF